MQVKIKKATAKYYLEVLKVIDNKINLMKIFKNLLIVLFAIAIASCSSNNTTNEIYSLTNANIAGNYNIQNFNFETDITTTSNNIPIKVATATATGDTFQVDLIMNQNGTYTAKGAYRIVARLTPVVGNSTETIEIINIDNSGNFTLNTVNNTITFSGDLLKNLSGEMKVETFKSNSFSLFQEIDVNVGSNVENISTNISFIRK